MSKIGRCHTHLPPHIRDFREKVGDILYFPVKWGKGSQRIQKIGNERLTVESKKNQGVITKIARFGVLFFAYTAFMPLTLTGYLCLRGSSSRQHTVKELKKRKIEPVKEKKEETSCFSTPTTTASSGKPPSKPSETHQSNLSEKKSESPLSLSEDEKSSFPDFQDEEFKLFLDLEDLRLVGKMAFVVSVGGAYLAGSVTRDCVDGLSYLNRDSAKRVFAKGFYEMQNCLTKVLQAITLPNIQAVSYKVFSDFKITFDDQKKLQPLLLTDRVSGEGDDEAVIPSFTSVIRKGCAPFLQDVKKDFINDIEPVYPYVEPVVAPMLKGVKTVKQVATILFVIFGSGYQKEYPLIRP